jgi:hypothetical protein
MAAFFFLFLTLPVITIHFDVDTFSPALAFSNFRVVFLNVCVAVGCLAETTLWR